MNDNSGGTPPEWPIPLGPRIFAYLKHSPTLPNLLQTLKHRNFCTLVYPDTIRANIKRQFESHNLRFATKRPDPSRAAQQCDFAILNATPGTTSDVLLSGKPILQFPLYGEQELLAEACERLGVSQTLWPQSATRESIDQTLDNFLANLPAHTRAAQAFAAKYAHFDPDAQRQKMLARTLELLESPSARNPAEFALHYP